MFVHLQWRYKGYGDRQSSRLSAGNTHHTYGRHHQSHQQDHDIQHQFRGTIHYYLQKDFAPKESEINLVGLILSSSIKLLSYMIPI